MSVYVKKVKLSQIYNVSNPCLHINGAEKFLYDIPDEEA